MEVLGRLVLLDDMVVFGAVCKSWRSVSVAAALHHKIRTPPAVPFLLLPEEQPQQQQQETVEEKEPEEQEETDEEYEEEIETEEEEETEEDDEEYEEEETEEEDEEEKQEEETEEEEAKETEPEEEEKGTQEEEEEKGTETEAEEKGAAEEGWGVRKSYCLAEKRIYRLRMPQTMGKKCFSIGFGWMLTIGLDSQIHIVHLLRRGRQISLPPPSSLPQRYDPTAFTPHQIRCGTFRKALASADPYLSSPRSSSPCIIMAIHGGLWHLAFTRPGAHDAWTGVDLPTPRNFFMDVVFHRHKFYAVTQAGRITVCTITYDDRVSATDLGTESSSHVDEVSQKYLVESRAGDLLLVCRILDVEASNRKREDITDRFEVLRLEERAAADGAGPTDDDDGSSSRRKKYEFTRVDSLGDQAIFVGDNASFSLTASSANGCKPNCIYFTHDEFQFGIKPIGSDMGVYNVGDGTIERIPVVHSLSSFCHPLWYI
ncbi:unnamed protein product [Cuscuta campestris]|uniref:KIB1-4 beta-propeller domain-containing protein n=1 Tax=Cuscuta campestris TaxID=132261 RepID=A0A484KT50_9ASTE|nr:unnamed protein product [Cuscuta campestris]